MILAAYKILHKHFGPQGWWPTTPTTGTIPEYTLRKSSHQLTPVERFEICLGAILTQNTNWGNVVRVLSSLKKEKLLNFHSLLALSIAKTERHFRSSGYFRQKTKRVRHFLRAVHKKSEGDFAHFMKGPLASVRAELLSLPGIGPETADSMLLYAAGRPTFVVDAYTRRVAERWGVLSGKESYGHVQSTFTAALPASAKIYREYHALIVKLAKEFCHKREPDCPACPLRKRCETGRRRTHS